MASVFNVSDFAISYVLKIHNYTYKKQFLYQERKEELRKEFIEQIKEIPEQNVVYIDESGIDDRIVKEYGWNIKGKRLMMEKSVKQEKN